MKFNIYSLRGRIKDYRDILNRQIDFDKHYKKTTIDGKFVMEYLEDVEIPSLEDFLYLFSEFEAGFGEHFGHITVNVVKREINVLDSWIE
ncbi:hypothetical protein P59_063 [Bacillus phage P59]|nr:hypothetical protein P59_063 [Bacillus phage P59]